MNQDHIREATIYAFGLLAAAQGRSYSGCTSFSSPFPELKPIGHEGAARFISTWLVPELERASGLSYKEWCKEKEYKQMISLLRSMRNSMAAHPDREEDSEFDTLIGEADRLLEELKNYQP